MSKELAALKEAREFVRFVEYQCPQYAHCIYDTLKECNIY